MTAEKYEAPKAIRLDDSDHAYAACGTNGSTDGPVNVGYRVDGFDGICVTGKAASGGCYAGVG